jgi:hypothetical protein
MKIVQLRSVVQVVGFTALFAVNCYSQSAEPVAYSIDQPIHIAGTSIEVQSVRLYGSQNAIEDFLLRSGIISDCNCDLVLVGHCNLSLLKTTRIPADRTVSGNTVRIEVSNPDDFIRIYSYFSHEEEKTLRKIQAGVLAGQKLRGKSDQAKLISSENEPAPGAQHAAGESSAACHKEFKVCISPKSASFVLGCEDIGEVEITTKGTISLSMSLPTSKQSQGTKN